MVERQPSKLNVASSSLVSRSTFCFLVSDSSCCDLRRRSSAVERVLGKDEVTGSSPVVGSGSEIFFTALVTGRCVSTLGEENLGNG